MSNYNAPVSGWPPPLARAYAACGATVRAHPSSIPVQAWLLPRSIRPHVAAVGAFVIAARGIAAQRAVPAEQRLTMLDAWRRRLVGAVAVESSGRAPHAHEDLIVIALAHTIRSLDLPLAWIDDLVSACGEDTMTTRYDSWSDVLAYCSRSTNPLGRLILRIAGYQDAALDRSSDALCTAIQLTRWWQDFSHDWLIGRLHVPREVSAGCRAREMDLEPPTLNDAWVAALRQCLDRTRAEFALGRGVCDGVAGWLRYERRVTWLAGMQLLDQVERAGIAIRSHRPTLNAAGTAVLLWRAARWRSQPPSSTAPA